MRRPARKEASASRHPVDASTLKRIFRNCDEIRNLEPWTRLSDTQVFGLRIEPGGMVYWASVLGANREVFAVNFYRGDRGFASLAFLNSSGAALEEEAINPNFVAMRLDLLQICFVSKRELTPWDRKALKAAKRPLPQSRAPVAPQLLSFAPGYLMWRPEQREADALARLLEAAIPALRGFMERPGSCPSYRDEQAPVWTLRPDGSEPAFAWESFPEPGETVIADFGTGELSEFTRAALAQLPQRSQAAWEMAIEVGAGTVEEKGERPYAPYVILICDKESGLALAFDIAQERAVFPAALQTLEKAVREAGCRPATLEIACQVEPLPVLEEAKSLGIDAAEGDCPVSMRALASMGDAVKRQGSRSPDRE